IALSLPGGNRVMCRFDVAEASRQTLAGQNRQFALGDVEPAAMFGRVVEVEFSGDAPRVGGRKRYIQRCDGVHAQVVEHHPNDSSVWVSDVDEPTHLMREVDRGASLSDLDVAPATQRLDGDEQIARAVAAVFVVDAPPVPRPSRNRYSRLSDELQQ